MAATSTTEAYPSSLIELASGVDAFYLSGSGDLARELVHSLDAGREAAAGRDGVPFVFGDTEFQLSAGSFGRYRFRLAHENGLIGVSVDTALPTFRVQPRAEFIHGFGLLSALDWFDGVVRWECDDVTWSVSRLDLFADWQGWALSGDDRERFVCRARNRDTHEKDGALTGFEFGRRTSKTICARIYDKTLQVEEKGLDWWYELWGDRYRPGERVLRTEFELGRTSLREFGLETPGEVLDGAGGLWASVTEEWLTYRQPSADQTKSRWPLAGEWVSVQHAELRSSAIGMERAKNGHRAGSLRRLLPALNGYVSSAAVHLGTSEIGETLEALGPHLHTYERLSGIAFADRVFDKSRVA